MTGWLRRALPVVLGALVLVGAMTWLSGGCGERIPPGERAAAEARVPEGARLVAVEERVALLVEHASGTVASARQTTVSSKILARIAEIAVSAGSVVARDDLLVRLDARDLEAGVREAGEELRAARARLELAKRERDRMEQLAEQAVASRQQLDRTRSEHRVAQAGVRAAEQRLADAEVGRSFAEIRSPVAGRVVDRLAEPGDTAAPGVPLLRIYDPGALRLEAPVRETLAVALVPGQTLPVDFEALGERFEGTIDEIVPFAEPGARTLLVKIRLPQHPRLYAGMFGRVEVPAGEGRRLEVPLAAVVRMGQLEFADVVGSNGRLERRLITTGPRGGADRVEVLSGLAAGEQLALPAAEPAPPTP